LSGKANDRKGNQVNPQPDFFHASLLNASGVQKVSLMMPQMDFDWQAHGNWGTQYPFTLFPASVISSGSACRVIDHEIG
ncbi:MAG TPA: hypothetical protein PLX50_00440, partial [Candidatus Aminicenantes bacterium]|nr:hypothetical protein [Candidatus Aminicenantes bacterium]